MRTLPNQEALVLETFLSSGGRVITKQELAMLLWPDEHYVEFDLAINNLLSKLRRTLAEDSRETRFIKTLPKMGYCMTCPVAIAEEPSQQSFPATPAAPDKAPAVASSADTEPIIRWKTWTIVVALTALLVAGFAWRHLHRAAVRPQADILGILPLTVTGSSSNFTGETVRGEMADAIAQIPGVQVRAAHSLTPDMGRNAASLSQAAHELSLTLLLTGTLSLSDTTYQLDLELVRGSDGDHLRSFHFSGPIMGLPNLSSQVENALFHYLERSALTTEAASTHTVTDAEAYAVAFQASQSLTERTQESLARAVNLFTQATRLDPGFARAWSGLAESYLVLADLDAEDTAASFDHARAAAMRTIKIDPSDARAHSVLGLILLQRDWKLNEAEHELRTAIQLNPGLAANHMRLAILLTDKMDFASANSEISLAYQLDPLWPVVHGTGMYVHIMAREYPAAIKAGRSLVAMRQEWGRAHQQLGWALWYGGLHAAAVQEWQQAAALDHNTSLVKVEQDGLKILQENGARAYAHAKLQSYKTLPLNGDFVPAEWHAFAGDKAETLDALEKLLRTHDPESLKIPINPAYDFLRNDPRFLALLQYLSVAKANAPADKPLPAVSHSTRANLL